MKALKEIIISSFAGAALLVSSLSLNAQVTYYGVEKVQFYSQTTNNVAPTTPYSYSAFGFADTTDPGQATGFTLTDGSDSSLVNLVGNSTSYQGYDYYGTKSALDAAFPSGSNFIFTANGGSLSSQTQDLPVLPDAYPQETYITGNGITAAEDLNPLTNFNLNIGYTGPGTSTATCLAIFSPTGNNVYTADGSADQASFTLSSSFLETLTPGQDYRAEIVDYNSVGMTIPGQFLNAPNSDTFADATVFQLAVASPLVVAPEPSAWSMILLGLSLLVFSKARGKQILRRIGAR